MDMRPFVGKHDWRSIEDAPFEEDVELFVTDMCGSFYGPVSPAGAPRKAG